MLTDIALVSTRPNGSSVGGTGQGKVAKAREVASGKEEFDGRINIAKLAKRRSVERGDLSHAS